MARDTAIETHPSDTDIFAAARHALDACNTVSATVRVHVDEGTVWLTGTARSMSERCDAERVVRGIDGVRDVVNKVVVTRPQVGDDVGAGD